MKIRYLSNSMIAGYHIVYTVTAEGCSLDPSMYINHILEDVCALGEAAMRSHPEIEMILIFRPEIIGDLLTVAILTKD